MQRLRLQYRPTALADLRAIYTAVYHMSGSAVVADRFVTRIRRRCRSIIDAPRGGRPRDDLISGLRTVPFEDRAIIAYVVADDIISILNIFYGGRDYEDFYRGKSSPAEET